MKSKDELIYDLIFSDNIDYEIDVSEYIGDIYKHDEFVTEIKKVLKKSKVVILHSSIEVDSKTVLWKLKVKK